MSSTSSSKRSLEDDVIITSEKRLKLNLVGDHEDNDGLSTEGIYFFHFSLFISFQFF